MSTCFQAALLVLLATPKAWLRGVEEDAIVVERSELIVEGRLKPDSIKRVEHEGGGSWEHHVTLVISVVHKGKLDAINLPIIVHYGLEPRIDKGGAIQIWDTGSSGVRGEPILEGVGKDHLWFLRKRSGIYGREPGTGNYGVVDPEDIRRLELKEYLLAVVEKHAEFRDLAQRYFDHMEILRILKLEDAAEKSGKLLPYFVKKHAWDNEREAQKAMIAVGPPAGAALRPLFDDPQHSALRRDVIETWGEIKYEPAVDVLTKMLQDQDKY